MTTSQIILFFSLMAMSITCIISCTCFYRIQLGKMYDMSKDEKRSWRYAGYGWLACTLLIAYGVIFFTETYGV